MKLWVGLVVALLLTAPAFVQASEPTAEADGRSEAACAAPCGFIVPFLDLNFPEKKDCTSSDLVLGREPTLSDCLPTPTSDQPVVLEGTFRLYWDVSYDGTYPADPNAPIEVSFLPTSTDPSWIDFTLDPRSFTLDVATLLNPQEYQVRENPDGTPAIWYWFERPVTMTFTRTAEPDEDDLERIANNAGVQPVFVKMRSTASGSQIRESYGIEVFRFDASPFYGGSPGEGSNDTPALPLASTVLMLATAAFVSRRRG